MTGNLTAAKENRLGRVVGSLLILAIVISGAFLTTFVFDKPVFNRQFGEVKGLTLETYRNLILQNGFNGRLVQAFDTLTAANPNSDADDVDPNGFLSFCGSPGARIENWAPIGAETVNKYYLLIGLLLLCIGFIILHRVFVSSSTSAALYLGYCAMLSKSMSLILTNCGKIFISKPRPYFCTYLQKEIIENGKVPNTDDGDFANLFTSIPSGHSSSSVACAVFWIVYVISVTRVIEKRGGTVWRAVALVLNVLLPVSLGLTALWIASSVCLTKLCMPCLTLKI